MSTLVVLAFPTENGAQDVMTVINDLQRQHLLTLDDAATVVRGQDGKPRVKQATSLVGEGAWGGAFWGLLFGLIFFVPLLGVAIGAAAGALAGSLTDVGISDRFIREVREKVTPGTSALFLLSSDAVYDRLAAELQGFDAELISTNLSNAQEAQLREAFGLED